jgi:hypothetical protein
MTPTQLREVFHVDHRDLVPNYELIELTHHLQEHHSISRRSVVGVNSDNLLHKKSSSVSETSDSVSKIMSKNNHHVKKDLSKVPFDGNSVSANEKKTSFHDYDLKGVREHNVSFNAFGEFLNLTLKPTAGLFRDGPNSLKMWHVRPDANASQGVIYERIQDVSTFYERPQLIAAVYARISHISQLSNSLACGERMC